MISYYELLGLIKEGKQPDKVRYGSKIYQWNNGAYCSKQNECTIYLMEQLMIADTDYALTYINNIEIIEENPKQIEKLNIEIENETTGNAFIRNEHGTKCFLTKHSKIIAEKVNELIDRTDYLLEVDKHE